MSYTAQMVQTGGRITWTNSTGSDVASKQVVVINSGSTGKIGITVDTITNTNSGEVSIGAAYERIWTLPKKVGDVFTALLIVYWDATNSRLTTSSTGNTRAGRSVGAVASAATSAAIVLND